MNLICARQLKNNDEDVEGVKKEVEDTLLKRYDKDDFEEITSFDFSSYPFHI